MTANTITNPGYGITKKLLQFLFSTLYPVELVNGELFKKEQKPYIVIANHRSYFDSLILIAMCPDQIRFLVKEELVHHPVIARFIKAMDAIPVQRHASDIKAFRNCIAALREKHILGIFPEGTRFSGSQMESPEPGAAMLAMMQKVELLPVYIGSRPRLFRKTKVIVGQGLMGQGRITSENIAKFCEEIKVRYRELRAEFNRQEQNT